MQPKLPITFLPFTTTSSPATFRPPHFFSSPPSQNIQKNLKKKKTVKRYDVDNDPQKKEKLYVV